jgi:hypothetical protein
MSTLAEKLSLAISSKADIRSALEEKLGEDPGEILADYAQRIRSLGGGRVSSINGVTPDAQGNVALTAKDLGISIKVEQDMVIFNV